MPITKREEYWIRRDGTKIAVGDMDVDHLRNTLRMIIRNVRRRRRDDVSASSEMSYFEYKDMSDAQAYRNLASPHAFFPMLEGGVYGSPELQKKYGGKL